MKILLSCLLLLVSLGKVSAASIWVEGEAAKETEADNHPWYGGQVKKDLLSGGDFISNFGGKKPVETVVEFDVPEGGDYTFWMRVNPVGAKLSVDINDGGKREISLGTAVDAINIASDGKPDLRFIAWVNAGTVSLKKGKNSAKFLFESKNNFHGSLDCFVFTNDGYIPRGTFRPEQAEAERKRRAEENKGWTAWDPGKDAFQDSPIDLRFLNENFAGEHGHIIARGEKLVRSGDGEEVRFWAVNGPPDKLDKQGLADCARMLAKHGVNLVRIHGSVFNGKTGELDEKKISYIRESVEALKKEGIYSHLSIYFPLWLKPTNGPGWREGYDGTKPSFATLYFEPEFQCLYRSWLDAILAAKSEDGMSLGEDPAVAGIELINEDSFFFWTFDYEGVPAPQMAKLEKQFGDWAAEKYGSIEKALATWETEDKHDNPEAGRLGFRGLWTIANEKKLRDQDTARFLCETQYEFYKNHTDYLRGKGFKGLITSSNWHTANPEIFGPLEQFSYTPGDIIDRHGYFGVSHSGDNSSFSIREGHTYNDRSALVFDGQKPGSEKDFSHPAMDIMTNRKPAMISETTWNRPNRYRGEAPLYYASYGALQGTDAIVHFALSGSNWSSKPRFFVQPWTLMAPTQMGQFPATALIYRKGLVSEGELAANVTLSLDDAFALKGVKMSNKANLDALREADVKGKSASTGGIDPLIHYVGRTNLSINQPDAKEELTDLSKYIDRKNQTVTSNTGELKLDFGNGLLTVNAPAAQGASGNFKQAGNIQLGDLSIESGMELGQIVAVSLDGSPLATAPKILLQVMTEEKPTGFETEEAGNGLKRITNLGTDPWLFKEPSGIVRMKEKVKVTALDLNGYAIRELPTSEEIRLDPKTVYYLLER